MSINIDKIKRLNELVGLEFRSKHTIVLDPKDEILLKDKLNDSIIIDGAEWNVPTDISMLVKYISKNNKISTEKKILFIYEIICQNYIYDDNVLSYLKKIDDDKYGLPDWYARTINSDFQKNRNEHNRRVCYEVSRYLAKSLTDLFKNNDNYDVCILWNKDLTHYFVGLTCSKYSLTLDLDDFFNIKDLTRLKTGLTLEGIKILQDDENIFSKELEDFNEGKDKYAIKKISEEIKKNNNEVKTEEPDDISFMRNALEILKEDYELDSQGMFEFMKEIADIKLGPESRQKVWKKLNRSTNLNTRYTRCLILKTNNEEYLIDVDEKILRRFDEKEFEGKDAIFIPYKELSRDWDEQYDGL